MSDLDATFKVTLDQYNKNLGFAVDISQKCMAMVLAFLGVFYSIHTKGPGETPLGCLPYTLITVGSAIFMVFFIWMQGKYHERCENGMQALIKIAPAAYPHKLSDLGILNEEHTRIIKMWSAAFLTLLLLMDIALTNYLIHGSG